MDENRKDLIFETKYWEIILSDDQAYLGYSIVVLKRSCGDLAELTQEEMLDFLSVVKVFEKTLRSVFRATMFNWACLMNHAYEEAVPKPQVHWHARPRYDRDVQIGGELFHDPNFGEHYVPQALLGRRINEAVRTEIISKIKQSLPT